jgi:Recombination endonuclease VII
MAIRTCSKCGTTKELDDKNFCPSKRYAGGLTRICRDCGNTYRAKWATMDRAEDIEVYHARELARDMKKYSTTVEWYRDMLIKQLGLCAICGHLSHHHGTLQRLQVDHDHRCCDLHTKSCGKCLRGLLCADCNVNLSYLELFLADLRNPENSLVDIRNALTNDSWTHRAMQYLRSYEVNLSTPWKTQENSACGCNTQAA